MLVTLLGITMLVRPEQLWNAYSPMVVTLLGITTLVRPEQPENASPAIPKVPSFTTTDVFEGIVPLYL